MLMNEVTDMDEKYKKLNKDFCEIYSEVQSKGFNDLTFQKLFGKVPQYDSMITDIKQNQEDLKQKIQVKQKKYSSRFQRYTKQRKQKIQDYQKEISELQNKEIQSKLFGVENHIEILDYIHKHASVEIQNLLETKEFPKGSISMINALEPIRDNLEKQKLRQDFKHIEGIQKAKNKKEKINELKEKINSYTEKMVKISYKEAIEQYKDRKKSLDLITPKLLMEKKELENINVILQAHTNFQEDAQFQQLVVEAGKINSRAYLEKFSRELLPIESKKKKLSKSDLTMKLEVNEERQFNTWNKKNDKEKLIVAWIKERAPEVLQSRNESLEVDPLQLSSEHKITNNSLIDKQTKVKPANIIEELNAVFNEKARQRDITPERQSIKNEHASEKQGIQNSKENSHEILKHMDVNDGTDSIFHGKEGQHPSFVEQKKVIEDTAIEPSSNKSDIEFLQKDVEIPVQLEFSESKTQLQLEIEGELERKKQYKLHKKMSVQEKVTLNEVIDVSHDSVRSHDDSLRAKPITSDETHETEEKPLTSQAVLAKVTSETPPPLLPKFRKKKTEATNLTKEQVESSLDQGISLQETETKGIKKTMPNQGNPKKTDRQDTIMLKKEKPPIPEKPLSLQKQTLALKKNSRQNPGGSQVAAIKEKLFSKTPPPLPPKFRKKQAELELENSERTKEKVANRIIPTEYNTTSHVFKTHEGPEHDYFSESDSESEVEVEAVKIRSLDDRYQHVILEDDGTITDLKGNSLPIELNAAGEFIKKESVSQPVQAELKEIGEVFKQFVTSESQELPLPEFSRSLKKDTLIYAKPEFNQSQLDQKQMFKNIINRREEPTTYAQIDHAHSEESSFTKKIKEAVHQRKAMNRDINQQSKERDHLDRGSTFC